MIAAKAIAFGEALDPSFKDYQQRVIANAQAMAAVFVQRGYKIVSGGTDDHLFLVDLQAHRPSAVPGVVEDGQLMLLRIPGRPGRALGVPQEG